jgi:hypothetical protein
MTTSKTPLFRLFGPLLCSLLTSCGSDTPEDPLKSANGFCGEWGKNVCVDAIVSDCAAASPEACQEAQRDFCLDRVSEALYTSKGAAECLAFIHDIYRDEELEPEERDALVSLAEPCDELLSGSGDKGDECNEDKDCATVDGLACVKRFGETRGQCHEPREVLGGGRCANADSVCVDDQYCNGTNCVAKSILGDPCSAEVPCDETTRCVMEADAEEGLCEEKKDVGDACLSDEECESALCDRNANEDEGRCVRALELNHRLDMCESFR